jgi:hypothetical protein
MFAYGFYGLEIGIINLCDYLHMKNLLFEVVHFMQSTSLVVKLSLYKPWRPLGLREVEASTFSDIWLIDSGKVVIPTRRSLFAPGRFLVLISVSGSVDTKAIVQLEGLGKLKKYHTSSGIEPATFQLVA